jgi:CRP-like cAMP-binding protein/ribonuclease BN (tRNA processing enzyme)
VLITHAHLDHIIGLSLLYVNTMNSRVGSIDVYATEPVISETREHLFCPEILPLPERKEGKLPGINFHPIELETAFKVGPYEVEAFPVFHTYGSVAYRVSDHEHTMIYTGDTGRTDRIWRWIRKRGDVDCLIAEISFPSGMKELAEISRHLTPQTLIESLDKAGLPPEHNVHVVHFKPAFLGELLDEIEALRDRNFIVLRKGDTIMLEPGHTEHGMRQTEIEDRVKDKIPEFDRDSDLYDQRKQLTQQFGVTAHKGEIVFRQGDKSKIMYIIQEGKVRIFRSTAKVQKTLSVLGPGDFFGEMAMLNNRPRSATIEALADLKLLAFDKPAFEKLIVENFGVALRIIRTLAQRLQEADFLIENLLYIDPQSKVVNTLVQTAYDEGIETGEGFLVRTTPEKLTEKSGVVITTLRGILAEVVEDKRIIARRETIIIPDVKKLRRLLKFLELKNEFS